MVVTANAGPYIGFGITLTASQAVQQYNEDRAPSQFDLGSGLMDTRQFYRYEPGCAVNPNSSVVTGAGQWQTFQLWDQTAFVDYVPITLNSCNIAIAATQTATAASAPLILAAQGSSVGAIATTITAPETGTSVSVIALDSTAAFVSYGQTGAVAAWNPAGGTGRAIVITTSSSGDGGTFSVAGRDMYGFKMTETIPISTATNVNASSNSSGYKWPGNKAFKYVTAVAISTTVTSTGFSVGTTDTYGFPAYLPYCGHHSVVRLLPTSFSSAATPALSSGNTVLASTAATQTSTTPDVRGTYLSTGASNGTLRIQISQQFDAGVMSKIGNLTSSAIFGGTQFSSV